MLRQKSETLRGDYAHARMRSLVHAMNRNSSRERVGVEVRGEKSANDYCFYDVMQSYITLSDNHEGLVAYIQLTGLMNVEIPLDDELRIIATRERHTIISPSQSGKLYIVELGDHEL